jgi:hypothetical protein
VLTIAAREHVLAIVVHALSPYVGATMAGASVRGLCQKLALEGARLDRSQVEKLINALAPGIHVFVGKEKALALVHEMWTALDALGSPS